MNSMHYKGYTAKVWYSEEDGCFVGRLMGITDIVSFDGDTVKQLEDAFHGMVDHYVEASERLGVAAQKPYSGKVTLRMDPAVHARAAMEAEAAGKSFNQWLNETLEQSLRHSA